MSKEPYESVTFSSSVYGPFEFCRMFMDKFHTNYGIVSRMETDLNDMLTPIEQQAGIGKIIAANAVSFIKPKVLTSVYIHSIGIKNFVIYNAETYIGEGEMRSMVKSLENFSKTYPCNKLFENKFFIAELRINGLGKKK